MKSKAHTSAPSLATFFLIFLYICGSAGNSAPAPAWVHHGTSEYEMNREIKLTGTVKEWTFGNPHTWLRLTVTTSNKSVEEWSIESAPPNYLTGRGWSASTLKFGEKLTIAISPKRGEARSGILLEVTRANGETLIVRPRGSFGRPVRVD